jgi:hypothetical protein
MGKHILYGERCCARRADCETEIIESHCFHFALMAQAFHELKNQEMGA